MISEQGQPVTFQNSNSKIAKVADPQALNAPLRAAFRAAFRACRSATLDAFV
jgi:hypothetical protein